MSVGHHTVARVSSYVNKFIVAQKSHSLLLSGLKRCEKLMEIGIISEDFLTGGFDERL